jgi:hypothetical protein
LHGDLIRGERDTVEIIDFKSEKKPDMEKDRDRLKQYQHQLEVYARGCGHHPREDYRPALGVVGREYRTI